MVKLYDELTVICFIVLAVVLAKLLCVKLYDELTVICFIVLVRGQVLLSCIASWFSRL